MFNTYYMLRLKYYLLIGFFIVTTLMVSCKKNHSTPPMVYMPDMTYSRAYETYAGHSNLTSKGIHYNNFPVAGTINRSEQLPFPYTQDAPGDTTNYVASRKIENPIPSPLDTKDMNEAERLFLINCAICHGSKLDGNGPLWNDGKGPFPAAPKNLVKDPAIINMPDGQMYYSITYGKNLMGSYASQLSRNQRWMIIHYIKSKQTPSTLTLNTTDSNTPKPPILAKK